VCVCVCVCVCLSSLLRSQFSIEFDETLHSSLGSETKIEFVGGSKSDNAFPYFTPHFPQISLILMYFQWDGLYTALSTPVDRLWWLIPHTTPLAGRYGCLTEKWHNPQCSSKLPKIVTNAFTMGMCLSNR